MTYMRQAFNVVGLNISLSNQPYRTVGLHVLGHDPVPLILLHFPLLPRYSPLLH